MKKNYVSCKKSAVYVFFNNRCDFVNNRKCVIFFGMLCFRQRFCQTNNLFIICTLLLATGFILQFKVLYNNHQKHLRVIEYQQRVNEVVDSLASVERLANHTSYMIDKLKMAVKSRKFKKARLKVS